MITEFTPYAGLIGGALIGLAAVILMLGSGHIAGCSGIFRGVIGIGVGGDYLWRLLFVVGLIAGVVAARSYAANAMAVVLPDTWHSVVGGLLVGFGTTLGNGCTSGHGICGLGRLSVRSLVAVVTFMGFGIITVFITRHMLGI